ncbi:MAG: ATP-binding protein, partial [Bacteroidota bacterium]
LEQFITNESLRFEELGGKIKLDLPSEEIFIQADRFHFLNVLSNLLDNALKYRKQIPLVDLKVSSLDKQIQIQLRDNGIGISKEHQQAVFQKFYRVPTGNIHNVKGFGIGLFYVKKICEAHQWQLDLRSEIDQFTEFTIIIPSTIKS